MFTVVMSVVGFVAGFGVGRIKNSSTVAKIKTAIAGYENSAVAEVRSLYAAVKAHL